jgi:hypothetical protein
MATVNNYRAKSAREGGNTAHRLDACATSWTPDMMGDGGAEKHDSTHVHEMGCGGAGKHDSTHSHEMEGGGAGKHTTVSHVHGVVSMQMGHRCAKCGYTTGKGDYSNIQWKNIRSGAPAICKACNETVTHRGGGGPQTIAYSGGDPLDGKVGNDIGACAEAMVLRAVANHQFFQGHCVKNGINQWQEFDGLYCPIGTPAPPEDYHDFIKWLTEHPGIHIVEVKQGGKVRDHKMMFEKGNITPQAKRMLSLCRHARIVYVMMHATPLREGTGKKKGTATIRWFGHDQMMRHYMPVRVHPSLSSIEVLTMRSFTRSLR